MIDPISASITTTRTLQQLNARHCIGRKLVCWRHLRLCGAPTEKGPAACSRLRSPSIYLPPHVTRSRPSGDADNRLRRQPIDGGHQHRAGCPSEKLQHVADRKRERGRSYGHCRSDAAGFGKIWTAELEKDAPWPGSLRHRADDALRRWASRHHMVPAKPKTTRVASVPIDTLRRMALALAAQTNVCF